MRAANSANSAKNVQKPQTLLFLIHIQVVQEVRDHFDCQELEGAELEDQGNYLSIFHFIKRWSEAESFTIKVNHDYSH